MLGLESGVQTLERSVRVGWRVSMGDGVVGRIGWDDEGRLSDEMRNARSSSLSFSCAAGVEH